MADPQHQGIMDRISQQPLWLGLALLFLLPAFMPLAIVCFPLIVVGAAVLYNISQKKQESEAPQAPAGDAAAPEKPKETPAPEKPSPAPRFIPKPAPAGAPQASSGTSAAPLTGSAALLARMRADRAKPVPKNKNIVVLYASQTGTAEEIAKGIAAEASSAGHQAKVRRSIREQRCSTPHAHC